MKHKLKFFLNKYVPYFFVFAWLFFTFAGGMIAGYGDLIMNYTKFKFFGAINKFFGLIIFGVGAYCLVKFLDWNKLKQTLRIK